LQIFDAVEHVRASQTPPMVRQALAALRACAGGLSVEQIRTKVAREVAVSPRQLTAMLKERTGRSFADLLREARIERACEMLAETDQTVAAIASEAGFCDQSYFTHVFQKIFKTTPQAVSGHGEGPAGDAGVGYCRNAQILASEEQTDAKEQPITKNSFQNTRPLTRLGVPCGRVFYPHIS